MESEDDAGFPTGGPGSSTATIGSSIHPASRAAHLRGRLHEGLASVKHSKPHLRRHSSDGLAKSGSLGRQSAVSTLLLDAESSVSRSTGASPRLAGTKDLSGGQPSGFAQGSSRTPVTTPPWPGHTPVRAQDVVAPGSSSSPSLRMRQVGMQSRRDEARRTAAEEEEDSSTGSEEDGGAFRMGSISRSGAGTVGGYTGHGGSGSLMGYPVDHSRGQSFRADPGLKQESPHDVLRIRGGHTGGADSTQLQGSQVLITEPIITDVVAGGTKDGMTPELQHAAATAAAARAFTFGPGRRAPTFILPSTGSNLPQAPTEQASRNRGGDIGAMTHSSTTSPTTIRGVAPVTTSLFERSTARHLEDQQVDASAGLSAVSEELSKDDLLVMPPSPPPTQMPRSLPPRLSPEFYRVQVLENILWSHQMEAIHTVYHYLLVL